MKVKELNKKPLIILLCIFILLFMASTSVAVIYFLKDNGHLIESQLFTDDASNTYVDLGNINVNLSDQGVNRYFKGQISLGYSNGDRKAFKGLTKDENLVVIKDIINFYFKSKNANFISNAQNEEKIKEDLITSINNNLQDFKITDIRFSSFVIQ